MNVTKLTQAGALQAGSDIWALPSQDESDWLATIDWYLNFLIARSTLHQKHELDPEILLLAKDWDFDVPFFHFDELDHLLVPCKKQLPTEFVIVHPVKNRSVKIWANEIFTQARNLQLNSVRLFLPKNTDVSQVDEIFRDQKISLSLVNNRESLA